MHEDRGGRSLGQCPYLFRWVARGSLGFTLLEPGVARGGSVGSLAWSREGLVGLPALGFGQRVL